MLKGLVMVLAVLVAALVGVTQFFAAKRERTVVQQYPPLGQAVDVDGTRIQTLVMGQGPDVVLIHGASGSMREFTFDFAQTLAKTHRVFIVDRPGLGHSDVAAPEYGRAWSTASAPVALQADLIRKAVRKLGADKPIIVGHSFGGAVALAWATQFGDDMSGLVMLGAVSNPWPGDLGAYYRVNSSLLGGALLVPMISAFATETRIKTAIASIFEPQTAPDGYADDVGAELILQRHAFRSNVRQVSNLLPEIKTMVPQYGDITVPTVIFHGDADAIVPLEVHSAKLVDQIPGAELVVLQGIGHMPHHTHRDQVIDAIKRISGL